MRIVIFGAASFIGTNLIIALSSNKNNYITAIDRELSYFSALKNMNIRNLSIIQSNLNCNTCFEDFVRGQDIVYHLISTTIPSTSNKTIAVEMKENIVLSTNLLEACIHQNVKKFIFLSSGGTVYGKEVKCPIKENSVIQPITSYGVQKVTIEHLIYLYNYMHGLDYRVIRLANPYGPYQRPNGLLGAVTTFTYKALRGEEIVVYGDGTVIRDYIYIDDAVRGIIKIVEGNCVYKTFNLGCGYGTSINEVLKTIQDVLGVDINICYTKARKVDVPVNYLDISRFETAYGSLNPLHLEEGVFKTASFMKRYYGI